MNLAQLPRTNPTSIFRYRDGLYAVDLLGAAISEFDFFTWLGANPSDFETICAHFEFAARPADVLLTLCVANGFIRKRDGCHAITELANDHLVKGSPWFLGPYFGSLRERPVCRDFVSVLRTGRPAAWGSYEDGTRDWHESMLTANFARDFTAAMNCRGLYLGQALASAAAPLLKGRRHVLDIGGGSGIYAATLVAAHPRLRGTVLEQPPVDSIARETLAAHGLGKRIDVVTGDIFRDPWPGGPDVHLLSNVLHDWDLPEVRSLLARSHEKLPAGGLLVIHEAFINEDKTGPLPVAEYSALLMHSTRGKCYGTGEYRGLLSEAGFDPGAYVDTAADRGFMTALKPI